MMETGMKVAVSIGQTMATPGPEGRFNTIRPDVRLEGIVGAGETYEQACERLFKRARAIFLEQTETLMYEAVLLENRKAEDPKEGWQKWLKDVKSMYIVEKEEDLLWPTVEVPKEGDC